MGKNIEIDIDQIKQRQIVVNIKTLLVVIGIIISGFTTMYTALTKQLNELKTEVNNTEENVIRIEQLLREEINNKNSRLDDKLTKVYELMIQRENVDALINQPFNPSMATDDTPPK